MLNSSGVMGHPGARNARHSLRTGAVAVMLAMAVRLIGGGVYLVSAQSSSPAVNPAVPTVDKAFSVRMPSA